MNKDEVIRGMHLLLAELHMSLATNKSPDPEILRLVDNILDWYRDYRSSR